MKRMKWLTVSILMLAALVLSVPAMASDDGEDRGPGPGPGGPGGGMHMPPPEAFEACDCKAEGDTAEMTMPNGDTITGTCEEMDGKLVLRPDNPPPHPPEEPPESE